MVDKFAPFEMPWLLEISQKPKEVGLNLLVKAYKSAFPSGISGKAENTWRKGKSIQEIAKITLREGKKLLAARENNKRVLWADTAKTAKAVVSLLTPKGQSKSKKALAMGKKTNNSNGYYKQWLIAMCFALDIVPGVKDGIPTLEGHIRRRIMQIASDKSDDIATLMTLSGVKISDLRSITGAIPFVLASRGSSEQQIMDALAWATNENTDEYLSISTAQIVSTPETTAVQDLFNKLEAVKGLDNVAAVETAKTIDSVLSKYGVTASTPTPAFMDMMKGKNRRR